MFSKYYLAFSSIVIFGILIISSCTTRNTDTASSNIDVPATTTKPKYYYQIQPGLFDITRRMAPIDDKMSILENADFPPGASPLILKGSIKSTDICEIDTFKYNWQNDTILCINYCSEKSDWFICQLISSMDSVSAFNNSDIDSDISMRRDKGKRVPMSFKCIPVFKEWNDSKISSICKNNNKSDTAQLYINRLIIRDGQLIDTRYVKCDYIDHRKIQ